MIEQMINLLVTINTKYLSTRYPKRNVSFVAASESILRQSAALKLLVFTDRQIKWVFDDAFSLGIIFHISP